MSKGKQILNLPLELLCMEGKHQFSQADPLEVSQCALPEFSLCGVVDPV